MAPGHLDLTGGPVWEVNRKGPSGRRPQIYGVHRSVGTSADTSGRFFQVLSQRQCGRRTPLDDPPPKTRLALFDRNGCVRRTAETRPRRFGPSISGPALRPSEGWDVFHPPPRAMFRTRNPPGTHLRCCLSRFLPPSRRLSYLSKSRGRRAHLRHKQRSRRSGGLGSRCTSSPFHWSRQYPVFQGVTTGRGSILCFRHLRSFCVVFFS